MMARLAHPNARTSRTVPYIAFFGTFLAVASLRLAVGSGAPLVTGTIAFRDLHISYIDNAAVSASPAPLVLLLHGHRFNASTWSGIGTLQLLASKGIKVRRIVATRPSVCLWHAASGKVLQAS